MQNGLRKPKWTTFQVVKHAFQEDLEDEAACIPKGWASLGARQKGTAQCGKTILFLTGSIGE